MPDCVLDWDYFRNVLSNVQGLNRRRRQINPARIELMELTSDPVENDTRVLIKTMRVAPENRREFANLRQSLLNDPYAAYEFLQQVGAIRDGFESLENLPSSAFAVLPGGVGIGGSNPVVDRRLLLVYGEEFQQAGPCIVLQPVPSRTGEDVWTGKQLGDLADCFCTILYARIPGTAFEISIVDQSGEGMPVIS